MERQDDVEKRGLEAVADIERLMKREKSRRMDECRRQVEIEEVEVALRTLIEAD